MIITGNREKNFLAGALAKIYPDATYCSKSNGFDLTTTEGQEVFALMSLEHDIIINCVALWKFNQTTLLDIIYKKCVEHNHKPHIINVGSTIDRVKNGKAWIYGAEKKALRDFSNTLGIGGVWDNKPKITYISFGTMSNNSHKHPDRKTLDIDLAAQYIKWVIDQPRELVINEISIDPMQSEGWYDN